MYRDRSEVSHSRYSPLQRGRCQVSHRMLKKGTTGLAVALRTLVSDWACAEARRPAPLRSVLVSGFECLLVHPLEFIPVESCHVAVVDDQHVLIIQLVGALTEVE